MKSTFKTEPESKKFKPFAVEITAETIEDARLLFHLYNSGNIWKLLKKDLPDPVSPYNENYNNNVTLQFFDCTTFRRIKDFIKSQGFDI